MKPYQPSNKVTSTGLKWLLLSSVIGGVAIGGLTHLLSLSVGYLIVVFPLVMGLTGGKVMVAAIRQGKVRNPAIATLFGVLTDCSCMDRCMAPDTGSLSSWLPSK